jgi:hypothetical protein
MKDYKIEDVLNSISNIEAATPKPFLATRVKAKLYNTPTNWSDKLVGIITKPVFAIATLLLIFGINAMLLMNNNTEEEKMDIEESLVSTNLSITNNIEDWTEGITK